MASAAEIREALAAIEHERWAHWQRYMHSLCTHTEDGSLVIPARHVERWERQIATPYDALTAAEKVSDREQVDRYWPLIAAWFAETPPPPPATAPTPAQQSAVVRGEADAATGAQRGAEAIEGDIIHVTEHIASMWVANMMPVRVLDGAGTGATMDEGYVLGYLDTPSLMLLHEDGTTEHWSTALPWQYIGRPTPEWRQRELIAAKQPRPKHRLPGEAPRTFALPPEPGPEVTAVRDENGCVWRRNADAWWTIDHKPIRRTWASLLADFGPLTDATGEAAP